MGKVMDITGQHFGRLIAIKRVDNDYYGNSQWQCECDCGRLKVIAGGNLIGGRTKSCGCFGVECSIKNNTTHGMRKSSEYSSWWSMIARCRYKSHNRYYRYGGRGIKVCDRWMKFENFYADMGPKPSQEHSIDRFPNNNGNYEPSNCRWATHIQQANNK